MTDKKKNFRCHIMRVEKHKQIHNMQELWIPWELFGAEGIDVVLEQFFSTPVTHIWGLPTILFQEKEKNMQLLNNM